MKLEVANAPVGVRSPWLKRAGAAGALLFLIKGLLWLLVPALLAWFGHG